MLEETDKNEQKLSTESYDRKEYKVKILFAFHV